MTSVGAEVGRGPPLREVVDGVSSSTLCARVDRRVRSSTRLDATSAAHTRTCRRRRAGTSACRAPSPPSTRTRSNRRADGSKSTTPSSPKSISSRPPAARSDVVAGAVPAIAQRAVLDRGAAVGRGGDELAHAVARIVARLTSPPIRLANARARSASAPSATSSRCRSSVTEPPNSRSLRVRVGGEAVAQRLRADVRDVELDRVAAGASGSNVSTGLLQDAAADRLGDVVQLGIARRGRRRSDASARTSARRRRTRRPAAPSRAGGRRRRRRCARRCARSASRRALRRGSSLVGDDRGVVGGEDLRVVRGRAAGAAIAEQRERGRRVIGASGRVLSVVQSVQRAREALARGRGGSSRSRCGIRSAVAASA